MTDDCDGYRERLAPAVMDELAPRERQELESHLAACPGCARERERLERTLAELGSLEDVPVPRHFLVTSAVESRQPWHLLTQLSRSWKIVLATGAAALLVAAGLSLARLHVRIDERSVTLGFGEPPPETARGVVTEQTLAAVVASVDRRLAARDRALVTALRQEVAAIHSRLDGRQRSFLEAAVAAQEQRLDEQWRTRNAELRTAIADFVRVSHGQVRRQCRDDLDGFSNQLRMSAALDIRQEQRMEALSTAVYRIAAASLPRE
jgi:hypothetical protein